MGEAKKKDGGGGYKWGSALIWAAGQWAFCWFLTPKAYLWTVMGACFSAFFSGWSTSSLLGRFAKWGANAWVMMVLGVLVGLAVFSGAFSGLSAVYEWTQTKTFHIDWDKLQDFFMKWENVVPTAALGLLTGLYVRTKMPKGKK
jgi:hypothetical protein